VIQAAIPDLKTADWQHLRRVVQYKFLPPHLQRTFRSPRGDDESSEDECSELDAELEDTVRYFLVSPTQAIKHAELVHTLKQHPPFVHKSAPPRIFYVTVPALAPTSAEQANQWTIDYWPIAYKNTNPYGPHPSLVVRNTAELAPGAGRWLALAQTAAEGTAVQDLGERIGCVVVDNNGGRQEVIAVAGDCRWRTPTGGPEVKDGPGNVVAHAVERVVAIIAKKRLRAAGKDPSLLDRTLFCDSPLTELEKRFYDKDNIASSGYLCVDLDIYITHEPCVMCSMAILHSRFKRCVIGRRMPFTGGMTADALTTKAGGNNGKGNGLGHGMFWRPSELNWKLLAWEWEAEDKDKDTKDMSMVTRSILDTLHA
jgi:tRNA-specific adenosine deaminase 3